MKELIKLIMYSIWWLAKGVYLQLNKPKVMKSTGVTRDDFSSLIEPTIRRIYTGWTNPKSHDGE